MNKIDFKSLPTLDPSYLSDLRLLDSDPSESMVNEILEIFFEIAPKLVAEIAAFAAAQDLKAMTGKAHSLKSSAGNLGANKLSAICKQLEHSTDFNDVPELVTDLKKEYDVLLIELKKEFNKRGSAA